MKGLRCCYHLVILGDLSCCWAFLNLITATLSPGRLTWHWKKPTIRRCMISYQKWWLSIVMFILEGCKLFGITTYLGGKIKVWSFFGPKRLDKLKDDVPFWHFLEGFLVVLIGVVFFGLNLVKSWSQAAREGRAREKGAKRKEKRGKEVATLLKSWPVVAFLKYFLEFLFPHFWGNDPIWRIHMFQMGWFNHQLDHHWVHQ